jgi:hypothetical protein
MKETLAPPSRAANIASWRTSNGIEPMPGRYLISSQTPDVDDSPAATASAKLLLGLAK